VTGASRGTGSVVVGRPEAAGYQVEAAARPADALGRVAAGPARPRCRSTSPTPPRPEGLSSG